jgi:hypothetical protein
MASAEADMHGNEAFFRYMGIMKVSQFPIGEIVIPFFI